MTLGSLAPWFVMLAGVVMVGVGLYVMVRAHRDPDNAINLAHLLIDGTLQPPRVTLAKATGLGAFLLSSWLMVLIGVGGGVDATLMAVYVTAWGAVKVAGDFTSLKERSLTDAAANEETRRIIGGQQ